MHSAEYERASARAEASLGHRAASDGALPEFSQIARLSNTTSPPAPLIFKTGTRPEGECFRMSASDIGRRSGNTISSNGAPLAFKASHGLRLQLDQFLVPMTSV